MARRRAEVVDPQVCQCLECHQLRYIAGSWRGAAQLAKFLSRRGWAGVFTLTERDWLRKHPPRWYADLSWKGSKSLQDRAPVARASKKV